MQSAYLKKPGWAETVFKTVFLTACALCLMAVPLQAQSIPDEHTLILGSHQNEYPPGPHLLRFEDTEGWMNASAMLKKLAEKSSDTEAAKNFITVEPSSSATWLAFKYLNNSNRISWVLDFGAALDGRVGLADKITVYTYSAPSTVLTEEQVRSRIDTSPFPPHLLQNGSGMPLTLPRGEGAVMIKIMPLSNLPVITPLKLTVAQTYLDKLQKKSALFTTLLLLLSGMAFYFIALAASRHSRKWLLFCSYYGLLALALLLSDTPVLFHLPLLAPFLAYVPTILSLLSIFLTKFALDIGPGNHREETFLYGLALVTFLSALTGALLPAGVSDLSLAFLLAPAVIVPFFLFFVCLISYHPGNGKCVFLGGGWMALLLGIAISCLSHYDRLPNSVFFINAVWFSFIPQALFFTVAAFVRVREDSSLQTVEKKTGLVDIESLGRLRQTKESAEQTRLLRVIEKEREILAQMREREAKRTEEMRVAKEAADEANRAKSAFLAVVSHEIRTPMTGIMGMVRLLQDSKLNKEQRDYALTIQDSGDAMLTLLNDILDFEKIERGRMEIENISFDLPRLVQSVATLMSGHATQKGIRLKTHLDSDTPRFVMGDPVRLRQVLLNLTGNAIKFTSEGDVTIEVHSRLFETGTRLENSYKRHSIYFAVKDSGIGISEEAQKNLFSAFSQADSSISRKYGGTGLGLAICKGLIEAMGSTIKITSEEGKGSTFHFSLMFEPGEQDTAEMQSLTIATARTNMESLHILVVDDNEVNRKVVVSFLQRLDHTSDTASSAEQALKMIQTNHFDLVLMDIQLDGISGDEATRVLRNLPDQEKARTPVIALSGNLRDEDIEAFRKAGMNGFTPKPIDPERLDETINRVWAEYKKAGGGQVTAQSKIQQAPIKEPVATDMAIFDAAILSTLKHNLGKDQLGELLGSLIEKTHEIIGNMQEAATRQDVEAIKARAHELKGMAGNFGLVEISNMAKDAEQNATDQDNLPALLSRMPEAGHRAETALKEWMSQ